LALAQGQGERALKLAASAVHLRQLIGAPLHQAEQSKLATCLGIARRPIMTPVAGVKKHRKFDLKTFLSTIDGKIAAFPKKTTIFAQGDLADSVFYIQEGKVQLTVVSLLDDSYACQSGAIRE